MKILRLFVMSILVLTIFETRLNAQSFDTTQYYGKMNYVFANVDKNQVSTGMLKDYGIEFLNLDNYTGTQMHDSNFVNLDEWRLLYASLYSSQVNVNSGLLYLDTINKLINKYSFPDQVITFACLYYNYNSLKSYTLTNNLMTVSNDQLFDVPNRPESPYQNNELFAVAPVRQAAYTGTNQIMFRPDLFLGNTGKTISILQIDPNGSGTYQTVTFNTPITVNYATKGFYNVNIKLTYTDGTIKYSHTKLAVYDNPDAGSGSRYGFGTITNENVIATKPYLGILGEGDITIDLSATNATGQIRKPLIVVEGFDPNGSFDFGETLNRITGDINLPGSPFITLNDGLDDINEYDLIFLNWRIGTDFIQRNAFLLERVIEIVNQRKTLWNGVRQQNVIIGMSMGGLVVRYALRDMELTSVDHETRLFISHDAPHWGANIPVGVQAAVQHLAPWQIINFGGNFPFIRWVDLFPQVVDALTLFNSPGARQIVIQRYSLSGETLSANNADHNNFLNEINTMGWPLNCRNVTLSNGSCNGTLSFPDNSRMFEMIGNRGMTYFGSLWRSLAMTILSPFVPTGLVTGFFNPQPSAWALLWQFPLSLFSTNSSINLDFRINPVPKTGTTEIYRGDVYSRKTILWIINVNNYFIKAHVNSTTDMLALDNAPGGVYDINEFGFDANIIQNSLPAFFNGFVQTTTLQPRFCFVPTVSSLAYTNPQSFLFIPVCNNANCQNPAQVQDYFAPQQNELHISYSQTSSDWILNTQNPNLNCLKICPDNITITGSSQMCGPEIYTINNVPVGAVYTWDAVPAGHVNIFPAGNTVTLTRIGNTNVQISLRANFTNSCRATLVTKDIFVGLYTPIFDITPLENGFCQGELYEAIGVSNNTGNITYNWRINGVLDSYHGYKIRKRFPANTTTISLTVIRAGCAESAPYAQTYICGSARFSISPNPSGNNIKVKAFGQASFNRVRIADKLGNMKKDILYPANSKSVDINISNLPVDIYSVQIFDGSSWAALLLSVLR